MKKSSILFLSAFVLLTGCTPNHKESSEESKAPLTLDETLEKLKGGYPADPAYKMSKQLSFSSKL